MNTQENLLVTFKAETSIIFSFVYLLNFWYVHVMVHSFSHGPGKFYGQMLDFSLRFHVNIYDTVQFKFILHTRTKYTNHDEAHNVLILAWQRWIWVPFFKFSRRAVRNQNTIRQGCSLGNEKCHYERKVVNESWFFRKSQRPTNFKFVAKISEKHESVIFTFTYIVLFALRWKFKKMAIPSFTYLGRWTCFEGIARIDVFQIL